MFDNNLKIAKSFYRIEVKYKTKYKTYWANTCDLQQFHVHIQGVEIEEAIEVNSLDEAETLMKDGNKVEIFYPWVSIVNIQLKRFTKD